jgi:hypothetical protein
VPSIQEHLHIYRSNFSTSVALVYFVWVLKESGRMKMNWRCCAERNFLLSSFPCYLSDNAAASCMLTLTAYPVLERLTINDTILVFFSLIWKNQLSSPTYCMIRHLDEEIYCCILTLKLFFKVLNSCFLGEIWDSHNSDYEECPLLGYYKYFTIICIHLQGRGVCGK